MWLSRTEYNELRTMITRTQDRLAQLELEVASSRERFWIPEVLTAGMAAGGMVRAPGRPVPREKVIQALIDKVGLTVYPEEVK